MASCTTDPPPPLDLSDYFSRTTKARAASSIKKFYKYFAIPGIGQLAGGLPNDLYFPYDTLEARVALPNRWPVSGSDKADGKAADLSSSKKGSSGPHSSPPPDSHLLVPHTAGTADVTRRIDLTSALQYGQAQGYPALYEFIKQFATENLHPNIPYAGGADVILTCGSTDGFGKTLQCFNNEWSEGRDPVEEREGLLVEQYAYMNAIQAARPRGMNIVPVRLDEEGMLATGEGGLEDVLENWDFARGKRPHIMYTVTIGQNPTSGTISVKRRKEIYSLCQKYDVIIVEDDPYWYLQYPSSKPDSEPVPTPAKSSGFPFLDSLVPSYLSVDVDGRVVRLDTFSKTVAPGCRLGWITAQPNVVERLLRITETSTQQPSGFVQSMIAELLIGPTKGGQGSGGAKDGSGWDMHGWVRWLEGLRGEYERRMTTMCDILDKGKTKIKTGRRRSLTQLVDRLAIEDDKANEDWSVIETVPMYSFPRPTGGMFLWITMAFDTHPLAGVVPGPRLAQALWILWTTVPFRVLVVPGGSFAPNDEIREQHAWKSFRLCFAAAPKVDLENIGKRFVRGVAKFWEIKDVKRIDELLEDLDGEQGVEDVKGMGMLTGMC